MAGEPLREGVALGAKDQSEALVTYMNQKACHITQAVTKNPQRHRYTVTVRLVTAVNVDLPLVHLLLLPVILMPLLLVVCYHLHFIAGSVSVTSGANTGLFFFFNYTRTSVILIYSTYGSITGKFATAASVNGGFVTLRLSVVDLLLVHLLLLHSVLVDLLVLLLVLFLLHLFKAAGLSLAQGPLQVQEKAVECRYLHPGFGSACSSY